MFSELNQLKAKSSQEISELKLENESLKKKSSSDCKRAESAETELRNMKVHKGLLSDTLLN